MVRVMMKASMILTTQLHPKELAEARDQTLKVQIGMAIRPQAQKLKTNRDKTQFTQLIHQEVKEELDQQKPTEVHRTEQTFE